MLKDPGKLNMTLYDLQGSKILEMNFGTYPAGEHQLIFPVYDLQSGMYIVKLTANDQIFTKKFSVLK
jgi:type IX secretion system substrate protein